MLTTVDGATLIDLSTTTGARDRPYTVMEPRFARDLIGHLGHGEDDFVQRDEVLVVREGHVRDGERVAGGQPKNLITKHAFKYYIHILGVVCKIK